LTDDRINDIEIKKNKHIGKKGYRSGLAS